MCVKHIVSVWRDGSADVGGKTGDKTRRVALRAWKAEPLAGLAGGFAELDDLGEGPRRPVETQRRQKVRLIARDLRGRVGGQAPNPVAVFIGMNSPGPRSRAPAPAKNSAGKSGRRSSKQPIAFARPQNGWSMTMISNCSASASIGWTPKSRRLRRVHSIS